MQPLCSVYVKAETNFLISKNVTPLGFILSLKPLVKVDGVVEEVIKVLKAQPQSGILRSFPLPHLVAYYSISELLSI